MNEQQYCPQCGTKIRYGVTCEGRRLALEIDHPVFTPVPMRQRDGTVREELVRTLLSLAWHRCPKRDE